MAMALRRGVFVEKRRSWRRLSLAGASCTVFAFALVSYTSNRRFSLNSYQTSRAERPQETEEAKRISLIVKETSDQENASSPWSFLKLSSAVDSLSASLPDWEWPPEFLAVRSKISTLLVELGRGKGSLYSKIILEKPSREHCPELEWDAEVRLGDDISFSERAFLRERRRRMRESFAKLIKVPVEDVDERDIPVVAIAGSGGGFRAMINTIGSLHGAQKSGILDCVTYTAGISGSCWALGVLYSGVAGSTSLTTVIKHIKERVATSYLDTSTLDILTAKPTNEYLLSGLLRKAAAPTGTLCLTDIYGTLVSARLFTPSDPSLVNIRHLSLHGIGSTEALQRAELPLPIFTAIHHFVPDDKQSEIDRAKLAESQASTVHEAGELHRKVDEIERDARWLWFEWTPYEMGCDELGGSSPTLENLQLVHVSPLSSMDTDLVTWTSVSEWEEHRTNSRNEFHYLIRLYLKEIQPLLRSLPSQIYTWLEGVISENDKSFDVMHPIEPNEVPNFVKGLTGSLREGSPEDITKRDHIGLMDAGGMRPHMTFIFEFVNRISPAELNIPYYPFLRRDVDCVIALDASADSQDVWFTRAEAYAAKRGLKTWPRGVRWPADITHGEHAQASGASTPEQVAADDANRRLAEAQESEISSQSERRLTIEHHDMPFPASSGSNLHTSSASTIWIGATSRDASRMDKLNEEELGKMDGLAIVYNPLVPNEAAVPGFNPLNVSTWAMQMDGEEVDKLVRVSEANFRQGEQQLITLLKATWKRKKEQRQRN